MLIGGLKRGGGVDLFEWLQLHLVEMGTNLFTIYDYSGTVRICDKVLK